MTTTPFSLLLLPGLFFIYLPDVFLSLPFSRSSGFDLLARTNICSAWNGMNELTFFHNRIELSFFRVICLSDPISDPTSNSSSFFFFSCSCRRPKMCAKVSRSKRYMQLVDVVTVKLYNSARNRVQFSFFVGY